MLEECLKSPEELDCDRTIIRLSCGFRQGEVCERERCQRRLVYGTGRWEIVLK